jgi:hypothetical protein
VAFFKASASLLFAALAPDETNNKPHRMIVTEIAATVLTIGDLPQCPNFEAPRETIRNPGMANKRRHCHFVDITLGAICVASRLTSWPLAVAIFVLVQSEGRLLRLFLKVVANAALSTGCAHQSYIRTDGEPIDRAQEQSTLVQREAEGATTIPAGAAGGAMLERRIKENAVINACMARNGYVRLR